MEFEICLEFDTWNLGFQRFREWLPYFISNVVAKILLVISRDVLVIEWEEDIRYLYST